MAYAALLSLAQVLHQTLNRDYQYLILDEKQQIESLVEIITAIQKDFSSQKITQDEEREIRDSAYIVEDIIESRIIERFRTESAGNEDGSTEKKLVRFNVLEDWIQCISRRRRLEIGLEIVGVGGVEKPITLQNINGIRELARTFRFKAWFLHSDVLLHDASTYETRFLHSDVLHDDASPYSNAIWTLERLANHGTEIVIIDTSSMGTSATMEKLSSFGFDTSLFVGAITSEDLRALIANRADDAWFEEQGPSNIDITSGAELKVTKKTFFTGLKHRKFFPQVSQVKKNFTLKIKWAWWKKPSPAPSPRPCATWFDRDATEEYKSSMVMAMAGVDADRCIVVTRDFDHIKVANTAGISSILIANTAGISSILRTRHFDRRFSKPIYGPDVVRRLAATYDAHPTYVLPSFTW